MLLIEILPTIGENGGPPNSVPTSQAAATAPLSPSPTRYNPHREGLRKEEEARGRGRVRGGGGRGRWREGVEKVVAEGGRVGGRRGGKFIVCRMGRVGLCRTWLRPGCGGVMQHGAV